MSGCHVPLKNVPLVNKEGVDSLITIANHCRSMLRRIEMFLAEGYSNTPEIICPKCNGKGSFVDDGIL